MEKNIINLKLHSNTARTLIDLQRKEPFEDNHLNISTKMDLIIAFMLCNELKGLYMINQALTFFATQLPKNTTISTRRKTHWGNFVHYTHDRSFFALPFFSFIDI